MIEFTVGIIIGVSLGWSIIFIHGLRHERQIDLRERIKTCSYCGRTRVDVVSSRGFHACGDCR